MPRKAFLILLAIMVLAVGAPACGSDNSSEDEGGSGNGIAAPIEAIPKAEEAARQTEDRAQQQQDQINEQLDQLP